MSRLPHPGVSGFLHAPCTFKSTCSRFSSIRLSHVFCFCPILLRASFCIAWFLDRCWTSVCALCGFVCSIRLTSWFRSPPVCCTVGLAFSLTNTLKLSHSSSLWSAPRVSWHHSCHVETLGQCDIIMKNDFFNVKLHPPQILRTGSIVFPHRRPGRS